MDRNEEERMMAFIEKQVESGRHRALDEPEDEPTPLIRTEDEPLVLNIKLKPKVLPAAFLELGALGKRKKDVKEELTSDIESEPSSIKSSRNFQKENRDFVEPTSDTEREQSSTRSSKSIRKESCSKEPLHKKQKNDVKGWLKKGLVVKIVTKKLGEKYYKAKGVLTEIIDDSFFVGKVKLMSPEKVEGHVVKIDQEHLETVIPAIGREVTILKGKHAGEIGEIKKVRIEDYCVDVELKSGAVLKRVPYENICKFCKL